MPQKEEVSGFSVFYTDSVPNTILNPTPDNMTEHEDFTAFILGLKVKFVLKISGQPSFVTLI